MRYRKRKIQGVTYSEHRLVWEQANGPIPYGYIVHHINHDKVDNRLSNLMLMTPSEHASHHNDVHARVKSCVRCGEEYEPAASKRERSKTCSGACFRALAAQERAGVGNGQAKLTDAQVAEIRRRVADGEMQKTLSATFGVSRSAVCHIVSRKTWRHVA